MIDRKHRKRSSEEAEINITPMLDIVFIMLIFLYRHHFLRKGIGSGSRPAIQRAGQGAEALRGHPGAN